MFECPYTAETESLSAATSFRPSVTVAVCTHERADELSLCLDALSRILYPDVELLVVDNAPITDETECLVHSRYRRVRYVCEQRPGLNWARNRAIHEASGEIIAFTDDDVVVEPQWINALVAPFADDTVMATTGLVVALEFETDTQIFFERYGGFGCGFERRRFPLDHGREGGATFNAGQMAECGTGANMAFRLSLFNAVGLFDPALDVGTVTNGGGDIDMFYRVMKEGFSLVYEPKAVVRHRHRREYGQLREQIEGWGTGFFACLARNATFYPEERIRLLRLGARAIRRLLSRWVTSLAKDPGFPRGLFLAELKGALIGVGRYRQSRRHAEEIGRSYRSPVDEGVQE